MNDRVRIGPYVKVAFRGAKGDNKGPFNPSRRNHSIIVPRNLMIEDNQSHAANDSSSNRFPYITDYVNGVFANEKKHWDYILLRPVLLVVYFFLRTVSFPVKFVLHRVPFGFEAKLIDWVMSFGMKYLARYDAAELMLRHVQIEPLLYRHMLTGQQPQTTINVDRKLNGIDGDFSVDDLDTVVKNNMTIGHDELSYELIDRFDRQTFLDNLDRIRSQQPQDHAQYSKAALEENKGHSWQIPWGHQHRVDDRDHDHSFRGPEDSNESTRFLRF